VKYVEFCRSVAVQESRALRAFASQGRQPKCAHVDFWHEWEVRKIIPPPMVETIESSSWRPQHERGEGRQCGRIATYQAGCRCSECREAAMAGQRRWRANRKAKKAAA
jgi:hypothetical protein